ncbi:hypothetical protein DFH09DRAFT_1084422 [Mycena vulgaris]|nr:hypothetical protein DFH09DRAFT_1084422 [Mycena vulgaris]
MPPTHSRLHGGFAEHRRRVRRSHSCRLYLITPPKCHTYPHTLTEGSARSCRWSTLEEIPAKLKEALIEATFRLTHWLIPKNSGLTDSFSAIIDQIIIFKATPIQPRNNYARLNKPFRYSVPAAGVFSTPTVRPIIIPLLSNPSLPPVHPANGPQSAFSGDGEMPADNAGDAGKAPESPEPTVDGSKGSGGVTPSDTFTGASVTAMGENSLATFDSMLMAPRALAPAGENISGPKPTDRGPKASGSSERSSTDKPTIKKGAVAVGDKMDDGEGDKGTKRKAPDGERAAWAWPRE